MTYCLGILTKSGIVGLADTRITSGTETTTAKKVFTINRKRHSFFIMASGLRSVRDKAITYFREVIENEDESFQKLYEAVNKFGEQVKRVAAEDKDDLADSGMSFNLYAIVGGQLEKDDRPRLYMLYPQGNWIEVGENTPYVIIGNTGFGKPILKRSLTYDSSLEFALKSGFLSFDATRISSNDVDYPIDTVVLENDSFKLIEHRFEERDLGHISEFWNERLRESIEELPVKVLDRALKEDDSSLLRKSS
jgi:putative proteasome-type protease